MLKAPEGDDNSSQSYQSQACAKLSMGRSYSLISPHFDIAGYIEAVKSVNGHCTWFSLEVRGGIHERHVHSTYRSMEVKTRVNRECDL